MSDRVAAIDNFEQLTPVQKQVYIKAALHYKSEYLRGKSESDGISAAAAFHDLIDQEIKEGFEKETQQASCHKGCSFCCYVHNEITDDEAQLLVEYAQEENIEIPLEQLYKQQGKTLEDYKTMRGSDRRCVFLDDAMSCKVYKHRPATCRKYYVASDPKLCDMDNNTTEDVLVIVSNPAEMIFTGMGLAVTKTGLMADMLIEKLNGQGKKD